MTNSTYAGIPRNTLSIAGLLFFCCSLSMQATIETLTYKKEYSSSQKVRVWRGVSADIAISGQWVDIASKAEVRKSDGSLLAGATADMANKRSSRVTVNVMIPLSASADEYQVWLRYPIETSGPDKFTVRAYDRGVVRTIVLIPPPSSTATPAADNSKSKSGSTMAEVIGSNLGKTMVAREMTMFDPRLRVETEYTLEATGEHLDNAGLYVGGVTVVPVERTATRFRFTLRFASAMKSFALQAAKFYDKDLSNSGIPQEYSSVAPYTGEGTFEREVMINPIITRVATPKARVGDQIVISGKNLSPGVYEKRLISGNNGGTMTGSNDGLSIVAAAWMDGAPLKLRYRDVSQAATPLPEVTVDVPGLVEVSHTLEVKVIDNQNAPISGARICVGTSANPDERGSASTNAQGIATLVIRSGGTYQIFAIKQGIGNNLANAPFITNGIGKVTILLNARQTNSNVPVCN